MEKNNTANVKLNYAHYVLMFHNKTSVKTLVASGELFPHLLPQKFSPRRLHKRQMPSYFKFNYHDSIEALQLKGPQVTSGNAHQPNKLIVNNHYQHVFGKSMTNSQEEKRKTSEF